MTEAKYIGRISPILADDWTDNVPLYHSYYDFHMKRKAAKRRLMKERAIFVVTSILIVCLCMSFFMLRPESVETYATNPCHAVSYGDTLWSIAKEYKSENESTRDFVYEIRKINNLKTSEIKAGDVLIIPE